MGTRRNLRVVLFPETDMLWSHAPNIRLLHNRLESRGASLVFGHRGVRGFTLNASPPDWSKTDLLHIHWIRPLMYDSDAIFRHYVHLFAQLELIKKRGIRIVYSMHNWIPQDSPCPDREEILQGFLFSLADAIIVHCRAAAKRLAGKFKVKSPVHRIPLGFFSGYPDEVSPAEARKILNLSPRDFVYLTFGFVKGYKTLGDLAAAFAGLQREEKKCTLVIAGEPTRSSAATVRGIEKLAARNKKIKTHFSYVPDAEVQLFFRACDAVVLPYSEILTSGVALLALAFAKPVVAPGAGCLPEYVPPGLGRLYAPHDKSSLQRAMREVREMSPARMAGALRLMERKLSWDSIAGRTLALYRELVR